KGWELKVFGYIDLVRAIYPRMKTRGRGVILNNIGNGGQNPDFNYMAGSTGNAALMAFTCALGGRSLEDGIRVIGVNPGPVAAAGSRASAAVVAVAGALGGRSLEVVMRGVGVNPGPVATERSAKVRKSHAARLLGEETRSSELLAADPRGRAATVEEVADMFVYLASPRSSYTSGTIVTIDGGISSKRSLA